MSSPSTGSGLDYGAILSALAAAGIDISNLANNKAPHVGQTAANIADPWGKQRGQYQDQLNAFMKDPSSVLKDPAFTSSLNLGLEGVQRSADASGMGLSGNTLAALQNYGQTAGYNAENNKFTQLAELAGVNAGSPTAAANAYLGGQGNQAQTTSGLLQALLGGSGSSGLIGQVIPLIKQILGGGGGGGSGTPSDIFGTGSNTGGSATDIFNQLVNSPDLQGVDPSTLQTIADLFGGGNSGGNAFDLTQGGGFGGGLDTSGIDPSTLSTISDIFGNGGGGTSGLDLSGLLGG